MTMTLADNLAAAARRNMVDGQLRPSDIQHAGILQAFGEVPRELFVPAALQHLAYADADVPLAPGRALLAPMTLGRLFQLAAVLPDERLLIIGGGTGYSSAIAMRLCKRIVCIEEDASLTDRARDLLTETGVTLLHQPLPQAPAGDERFDVVMVEGAVERLPEACFEVLKPSGRIVSIFRDGKSSRLTRWNAVSGAQRPQPWHDAAAPLLPGFARQRPAFSF